MAVLIHEIWEEDSDGMILHTCCLAGPLGDSCRKSLEKGARLVTTFEAGSHFEAMNIYNQCLGREKYTSTESWDYLPYPDEWSILQQDPSRSTER